MPTNKISLEVQNNTIIAFFESFGLILDAIDSALKTRNENLLHQQITEASRLISVFRTSDLESEKLGHDMTSPMTSILFLVSFVEDEDWDGAEIQLGQIRDRISELRDGCMDLSIDKEVNLANRIHHHVGYIAMLVTGVVSMHEDRSSTSEIRVIRSKKPLSLSTFTLICPRTLKVETNWSSLARIIDNLVRNAVDHNRDLVELTVRLVIEDHEDSVEIQVLDSGNGIDDISHIFELRHTTGAERGNSGLGLAISDKLAENINARIAVEGHGGIEGGAKFTLSLPKHQPSR
jgi:signal transduction histidine kinase